MSAKLGVHLGEVVGVDLGAEQQQPIVLETAATYGFM